MSTAEQHWITALLNDNCEFHAFGDIKEAVRTLRNLRYDLIMLDDTLFDSRTPEIINEVQRRFPSIPVILLSENTNADYHQQLMQSGADDYLTPRLSRERLNYRIQIMLKQRDQSHALKQLNHNLHTMGTLARLLYSTSDPYTLIFRAIKLLRNTFRLYGVVIMLREGDVFRVYAGGEETSNRNKLYESIIRPSDLDPFLWAMQNKVTQLYHNVTRNTHFTPVPILPEAESAAIISLVHQDSALGAMGVFLPPGHTMAPDDLIIYETFGSQLISALQNANVYQVQNANIQSSQHLLRAWQVFAALESIEAIAPALQTLVGEVPDVAQAFVWFEVGSLAVNSNPTISTVFMQVRHQGVMGQYLSSPNNRGQPVLIRAASTSDSAAQYLFDALQVDQIALVPVTSSTRLIGGIMVGLAEDCAFSQENMNLLANLANIAGQVVERITLNTEIREQNSHLAAILSSTSEGMFFVDSHNQYLRQF